MSESLIVIGNDLFKFICWRRYTPLLNPREISTRNPIQDLETKSTQASSGNNYKVQNAHRCKPIISTTHFNESCTDWHHYTKSHYKSSHMTKFTSISMSKLFVHLSIVPKFHFSNTENYKIFKFAKKLEDLVFRFAIDTQEKIQGAQGSSQLCARSSCELAGACKEDTRMPRQYIWKAAQCTFWAPNHAPCTLHASILGSVWNETIFEKISFLQSIYWKIFFFLAIKPWVTCTGPERHVCHVMTQRINETLFLTTYWLFTPKSNTQYYNVLGGDSELSLTCPKNDKWIH